MEGAIVIINLISWGLVIVSSIWVFNDAQNLNVRSGRLKGFGSILGSLSPLGWSILCFLFWIIGFPAYLLARPKFIAMQLGNRPNTSYSNPARTSTYGSRKCPFCAEDIQAEARLCKHCKSQLNS